MPTYVYRCDVCAHQFELMQRFADDPIDTCPACGATVRRVFQPVGVVFKGSGWYINDSRTPATATAETKTEAPTDASKPATSAEAKSDAPKAAPSEPTAKPAKAAAAS